MHDKVFKNWLHQFPKKFCLLQGHQHPANYVISDSVFILAAMKFSLCLLFALSALVAKSQNYRTYETYRYEGGVRIPTGTRLDFSSPVNKSSGNVNYGNGNTNVSLKDIAHSVNMLFNGKRLRREKAEADAKRASENQYEQYKWELLSINQDIEKLAKTIQLYAQKGLWKELNDTYDSLGIEEMHGLIPETFHDDYLKQFTDAGFTFKFEDFSYYMIYRWMAAYFNGEEARKKRIYGYLYSMTHLYDDGTPIQRELLKSHNYKFRNNLDQIIDDLAQLTKHSQFNNGVSRAKLDTVCWQLNALADPDYKINNGKPLIRTRDFSSRNPTYYDNAPGLWVLHRQNLGAEYFSPKDSAEYYNNPGEYIEDYELNVYPAAGGGFIQLIKNLNNTAFSEIRYDENGSILWLKEFRKPFQMNLHKVYYDSLEGVLRTAYYDDEKGRGVYGYYDSLYNITDTVYSIKFENSNFILSQLSKLEGKNDLHIISYKFYTDKYVNRVKLINAAGEEKMDLAMDAAHWIYDEEQESFFVIDKYAQELKKIRLFSDKPEWRIKIEDGEIVKEGNVIFVIVKGVKYLVDEKKKKLVVLK